MNVSYFLNKPAACGLALMIMFIDGSVFAQTIEEDCGFSQAMEDIALGRIATPPPRPDYTWEHELNSVHFKIHYTLVGHDSTTIDWAGYVRDYAEDAYSVFSDSGWALPPPDDGRGGDNRYDIYIKNTRDRYYWGATFPDEPHNDPYSGGYSSFITVHRDSIEDGFPKYERLEVLLAHEFSHACQLRYNHHYDSRWFYENTSVFAEDLVNDDVNTLYNRFSWGDDPLDSPHLPINNNAGVYKYSGALWPIFLAEYYGASVPREIWERWGNNPSESVLSSIDYVLSNNYNSDLETALENYAFWRYFTGAGSDGNHFSEGEFYPVSERRSYEYYPVNSDQQNRYPSGPGGTAYIQFRGAENGLKLIFDGQDNYNWRVNIIDSNYPSPFDLYTLTLDADNTGGIFLPESGSRDRTILIPVVTDLDNAPNLLFDFSADNGQDITFRNKIGQSDAGDYLTVNGTEIIPSGASRYLLYGSNNEVKPNTVNFVDWLGLDVTYKHHDWNMIPADFKLTKNFTVDNTATTQYDAIFSALTNANLSASHSIAIEFHDPWYYDETTQTQPDDFRPVSPGQHPVFMNQGEINNPNSTEPIYRLKAPSVAQVTESEILVFDHWSGVNVDFGNGNTTTTNRTTKVVFLSPDVTSVTANYTDAITTQGRTVEIAAGDTMNIPPGANYSITNTALAIDISGGVLNMIGSPENRIVLDIPQGGNPWGGIDIFPGELNMEYVDIGNSAGVEIFGGSITINNTSFIDNPGRAIYIEEYSDAVVSLQDVNISGSLVGIYADGKIGNLTVNNSTLTGTNVPGSIGLFAYRDAFNITIERSSITGFSNGLKLHLNRNVQSSLEIINSTIAVADTGLFIESDFVWDDYDNYWKDTLIFRNNIFTASIPYYSTDSDPIQNNPNDPARIIGYNNTYSTDGSVFDVYNWVGDNGNISADPLFDNDYHLTWANVPVEDATKSLCIDTGDPALYDSDGTRSDMGAFPFLYYTGDISEDTVIEGDVNIPGDLTVLSGATLTIMPGSTLRFAGGKKLRVYGALIAEGTEESQITFTSAKETPAKGDWYGIRFEDSSVDAACIIKYADIEYARYGIYCYKAEPAIENNTITNSSYYGIYLYYAYPTIKNNDIQYSGWRGIYGYESDSYIENNTITYNSEGVYFYRSIYPRLFDNSISNNDIGVYSYNSSPKLGPTSGSGKGNNVVDENYYGIWAENYATPFLGSTDSEDNRIGGYNTVYGNYGDIGYENVRARSSSFVDAQHNWWGSSSPVASRFNSDGTSTIDYTPYLSSDPGGGSALSRTSGDLAFGFSSSISLQNASLAGSRIFNTNEPDTNTVSGLWKHANDLWFAEKYDKAINVYKMLVRKFSDSQKARYALVKAAALYEETKKGGLSGYLNSLINKQNVDAQIRIIASDLLIGAFIDEGKLDKAVRVAEKIIKRYPDTENEYVAMFELFSIYRYELNDSTKAEEMLQTLKQKYPDYNLTMTAQVEMGEDVDITKIIDFSPAGKKAVTVAAVEIPDKYSLGNNYPNPFNPSTMIPYELPEDSYVSLLIYDVLGREIIKLLDGEVTAGYRQVMWNGKVRFGSMVSSGVYFYRITARGLSGDESSGEIRTYSRSDKMIMVR